MALAHWRKLRGMDLELCISPDGADGAVAVTGRSSGLAAIQIDSGPVPSLKLPPLPPLPPTWTVCLPGLILPQLWLVPPLTGDGHLISGQHKPTGVTILARAPLPGSPGPAGGRWMWGPVNPWTLPAPAVMPLEWWRALPKRQEQVSYHVKPRYYPNRYFYLAKKNQN
jgi:hypothetical protein